MAESARKSRRGGGSFRQIFCSHFIGAAFLGLLLYDASRVPFGKELRFGHIVAVSAIDGVLIAALIRLFHWIAARSSRRSSPFETRAELWMAILVAFVAGTLATAVRETGHYGLFGLSAITLIVIALYVTDWFKRVAKILSPEVYATWTDVIYLVGIYATLLAAFTILHLTLSASLGGRVYTGEPKSILDYLYFSVVVMTTLGFGDIAPTAGMAKLLVMVQCLSSYLMLALLIGVMTKGVLPPKKVEEEIEEDAAEQAAEPDPPADS